MNAASTSLFNREAGGVMTFGQAIGKCFMKYADFDGRASRPEFWWFILFVALITAALQAVSKPVSVVFQIGMLLPCLSAGARRLHDTDKSGWWQLLNLVPVAGWIVVIVLMCQPPKEPNRYSAAPEV
jgi:uncharacterized membrane protein YhaH (DUF805 family)